jgi:ADP-ribose pyrophosphatase
VAELPAPEPAQLIDVVATLSVRKLRMEIQRLRLPVGVEGTYGCIRHPGAALAVPLLPDGRVVILRQYRFAVQRRILEFPAGTLEPGEPPRAAMERELQEEAGYRATRWDDLGLLLPCPGYSDEVIHLFMARDLEPLTSPVQGDHDEDIQVLTLSPAELDARLASGEEPLDGKTVTAWFRARQLLQQLP